MQRRIDEQLSKTVDHAGSRVHVINRQISELKLNPKNPRAIAPGRSVRSRAVSGPLVLTCRCWSIPKTR